jgi:hypothetical protein
MAFRCPYCGYSKNYEYYVVKLVISVVTTWAAFQYLDSKIHITDKVVKLFAKLF